MKLVHSGRNGRQNSNSASSASPSAGQVSHLALGRASLSLVRGIEMRQRYVATSIRRSCERGEKNLRENPSYHTARRRENIRMQHVERRTCRAGMRECCCWAPQWQSMISTSPKSPTVRSDDTDARSCCIRHPGSLDITDPSIPLITGILMELICPHALTPPSQDKWTRRPTDVIQQWRWCTVL